MFFNTTNHYTFTTGGFGITLNALGSDSEGRNYTQCFTVSGANLYVYIDDEKKGVTLFKKKESGESVEDSDELISRKYALSYPIVCYPTHFSNNLERYVYAAIPRDDKEDAYALIVFPDKEIDIFGCYETTGTSEDGEASSVQYGDPSYYYINLFGIISSASEGPREWQKQIVQGAILGHIVGDEASNTRAVSSENDMYDLLLAKIHNSNFFEKRSVGDKEPVYELDEFGNIVKDIEGNPVISKVQEVDEIGNLLYLDASGKKTTYDTGTPSMVDNYNYHEAIFLKDRFDYLHANTFTIGEEKKPFTDLLRSIDQIPAITFHDTPSSDDSEEDTSEESSADNTIEETDSTEESYPSDQLIPSVGYVSKAHISRLNDDQAKGHIVFMKGLETNKDIESTNFVTGFLGEGWKIWKDGHGEMDSLSLRKFLEVPELRFNRVSVHTGVDWQTFGGGIIESVTILSEDTGFCKIKLEDGEYGAVAKHDKCIGIYHNIDGNNATTAEDYRNGNFEFMGFQTVYFLVTDLCDEEGNILSADESGTKSNQYFRYQLRDASADKDWKSFSAGKHFHPQPAMHFAAYANKYNKDRQACIYSTIDYTIYLKGMTEWTYGGNNIALINGLLDGFKIETASKNDDGTPIYKSLSGVGFASGNIYMWGSVEQFDRAPYLISQQIHTMSTKDDLSAVLSHIELDENGKPAADHWKNLYNWADGTEPQNMQSDDLYIYQYWTFTYDTGSGIETRDELPFLQVSFADRRYLEPSLTAIRMDETFNYADEKLSCRQMQQIGSDAPFESADMIISYSVDGGEEKPYDKAHPIILADAKPKESVNFYLRDADGVLYDNKTIVVQSDGASAARIIFSQDIIPVQCASSAWGDDLTSEADAYYYLSKDYTVTNDIYVMAGTERRSVKKDSVSITFDPSQVTSGASASVTSISLSQTRVQFKLLKDRFRSDRNTTVTVSLRYEDGTQEGASLSGSFVITYNMEGQDGIDAMGSKGASVYPVLWEDVRGDESFLFCCGDMDEQFIHMVGVKDAAGTTLWYQCIASVTVATLLAISQTPAEDTTHFRKANNFKAIATEVLYAKGAYIENACVRWVDARSKDGKVTCSINGDTGELVAKKVNLQGRIEAESGLIGGFLITDKLLVNKDYEAGIKIETANATQTVHIGQAAQYGNENDSYAQCSISASSSLPGKSNREIRKDGLTTEANIRNNTSYNTVLHLEAKRGTYNNAFTGSGNGFLNGAICGYRAASVTLPNEYLNGLLFLEEGTTAIIQGKADEGKTEFTLPSLENVRRAIGYPGDVPFAIPYTIINLCEQSAREISILNTTSPNGSAPYIIDNDKNRVKSITMSAGDVFHCILVYTGGQYFAVQDSYPNFSLIS